jgi:hypothetical protein
MVEGLASMAGGRALRIGEGTWPDAEHHFNTAAKLLDWPMLTRMHGLSRAARRYSARLTSWHASSTPPTFTKSHASAPSGRREEYCRAPR